MKRWLGAVLAAAFLLGPLSLAVGLVNAVVGAAYLIYLLAALQAGLLLVVIAVSDAEGSPQARRTVFTALALMPMLAISVALWKGLPPEPPYFRSANLFLMCFLPLGLLASGIGLHWRELACERGLMAATLLAAAQVALSILVLVFPVAWTLLSTQTAAALLVVAVPKEPEPCNAKTVDIAHISDTHITVDGKKTNQNREGGAKHLGALLSRVVARTPAFVVISGDVTDHGTPEEWQEVLKALQPFQARTAFLLAPGNHDVHGAFGTDPSQDRYSAVADVRQADLAELPRLVRVAAVQQRVFRGVMTRSAQPLGTLLERVPTEGNLAQFGEARSACALECRFALAGSGRPAAAAMACDKACNEWRSIRRHYFKSIAKQMPWYVVDTSRQLMILIVGTSLDAGDGTIGRNAIGTVSEEQLAAIAEAIRVAPAGIETFAFVFHHFLTRVQGEAEKAPWESITEPRISWPAWWSHTKVAWEDSVWWANAFLRTNPPAALRLLTVIRDETRRRGGRAIAFFGHRHKRTLSEFDRVTLVEAPHVAPPGEGGGFYAVNVSEQGARVQWCSDK